MNSKRAYEYLKGGILLLAILSVFGIRAVEMMAQEGNQWTPQERVPIYKDFTQVPPILIADQNHTVHAFNSQPLELGEKGSLEAIFYRQWTIEQGWSIPNDIIVSSEDRDVGLMDVYFDEAGIVHVVLQIESNIFHSMAPLLNAEQASAWSNPKLIGGQAVPAGTGTPYMASIAGDKNGNLVIIYSGTRDGSGIYAIYSADNGDTWSEPVILSLTYDDELDPAEPRLLGDRSGKIHAVWSVYNEEGVGVFSLYTHFDVEAQEWSKPIEIDEGGIFLGTNSANLFEYGSELFLTYYQGKTNGNWWRRSGDGGLTWTEPAQISSAHKGTNGPASSVIDSDDVLHLFFGQRINSDNHGMWHSIWNGQQWSEPTAVVNGPQIVDDIGGNGFDPRSARAAVMNGNIVLVTWGTDGAGGLNGAWYSYTMLNTPELPEIALPAVPSTTATATATGRPTAAPSLPASLSSSTRSAPTSIRSNESAEGISSPGIPIIIGLVPVTLLILIFVTMLLFIRHGRH